MKFDITNLYINVPSGSNRLFLCSLDVLNVLYCHQPVPVTSCHVTRLRVGLRGGGGVVCVLALS